MVDAKLKGYVRHIEQTEFTYRNQESARTRFGLFANRNYYLTYGLYNKGYTL